MTYLVTENCINCKYTDCVEVCPVDCFYEGVNMLVIHPDECIDCSLCVPECPIDAIIPEEDATDEQAHLYDLNKEMAEKWSVITQLKDPPADADEWVNKPDKLKLLIR